MTVRIVSMIDGPCDLAEPHDEAASGKEAEARTVLDRIKNAGGAELHLCFNCRRALVREARASYRFVPTDVEARFA